MKTVGNSLSGGEAIGKFKVKLKYKNLLLDDFPFLLIYLWQLTNTR